MCLVIFAWLVAQDYFKEMTDNDIRKRIYEEQKNQIEQDITPFGFISDGLDDDTFVDSEGDRWHTDEYGDRLHVGLQMISFLLFNAGFLNLLFYVFAIGFVISLILEQFVKNTGTEEELFIVQTNRKYCWRQAWVTNILWFFCNVALYIASRNLQPVDNFWNGI